MAIMVVDESNIIMWMNATAYTMFKVSKETTPDDMKWDSLLFSLDPEGATPGDLLVDNADECDSLGPFKAFITDSNTRVEVNVKKVQFDNNTYACCYLSPDTKYVHHYTNSLSTNDRCRDEPVLKCSLDAVIQAGKLYLNKHNTN